MFPLVLCRRRSKGLVAPKAALFSAESTFPALLYLFYRDIEALFTDWDSAGSCMRKKSSSFIHLFVVKLPYIPFKAHYINLATIEKDGGVLWSVL